MPTPSIPDWDLAKFQIIVISAIMLAIVGCIDSLLTSLVADAVTKTHHDSERELMGQGIGNIVAGLIGGLPGAGATMRTVVNVRSGGRTHLSGVIHAVLLLAILLALGPLASEIPMAVLAGILITVGIGIVDTKGLGHVIRAPRGDAAVMITVFVLTVFVDLLWAVAAGMIMASMILLKRLSDIEPATHSPLIDIAAHRPWIPDLEEPQEVLAGIYVVEIHGSLFFGNAGPLQRKLGSMEHARAVVLHMGDVRYVDQSGVKHACRSDRRRRRRRHRDLHRCAASGARGSSCPPRGCAGRHSRRAHLREGGGRGHGSDPGREIETRQRCHRHRARVGRTNGVSYGNEAVLATR